MTGKEEITPQELDRFSTSFKDPSFRSLFFDYMKELENPETRNQYSADLAHAEMAQNSTLIVPNPHFCVQIKNIAINICSHLEIQVATSARKTVEGKTGEMWSIPYSCGKERIDHDLRLWDVVFAPKTIERSESDSRFKTLMVETAFEAAGVSKSVLASTEWKVLDGVKSKGTPKNSMVKKEVKEASKIKNSVPDVKAKSYKQDLNPQNSNKEASLEEIAVSEIDASILKCKVQVPIYQVIHQNKFKDYQKFTSTHSQSRPDCLKIRVTLPGLESAKNVDLDVTETSFSLLHERYSLEFELPFVVDKDSAVAKFDKTKGVLSVTVDVVPAPAVQLPIVVADEEEKSDSDEDVLDCLIGGINEIEISKEGEDISLSPALEKSDDKGIVQDNNIQVTNSPESSSAISPFGDSELEKETLRNRNEVEVQTIMREADSDDESVSEIVEQQDLRSLVHDMKKLEIASPILPDFQSRQDLQSLSFIVTIPILNAERFSINIMNNKVSFIIDDTIEFQIEYPVDFADNYDTNYGELNTVVILYKIEQIFIDGFIVNFNGTISKYKFLTMDSVATLDVADAQSVKIKSVQQRRNEKLVVVKVESEDVASVDIEEKVVYKFANSLVFELD